MKRFLLLFLCLVLVTCKSTQKHSKEINVLFIGNSLTYFHDMPQTVQEMLNETDSNIKISQSTFPGMSLDSHLDNIITATYENGISTRKKEEGEQTETELKILEKSWDIIILQSGTVGFLIPETRKNNIEVAINKIKEMVNNTNCEFILFNTWPSKVKYPKQYCHWCEDIDASITKVKCCSSKIENLEQHLALINETYLEVATNLNLKNSDNPNKVYNIITKHPEVKLYEDDIHPSAEGSFLNACIFYQMITGKKAEELNYIGNILGEHATLLKQIAK